MDKENIPQL